MVSKIDLGSQGVRSFYRYCSYLIKCRTISLGQPVGSHFERSWNNLKLNFLQKSIYDALHVFQGKDLFQEVLYVFKRLIWQELAFISKAFLFLCFLELYFLVKIAMKHVSNNFNLLNIKCHSEIQTSQKRGACSR